MTKVSANKTSEITYSTEERTMLVLAVDDERLALEALVEEIAQVLPDAEIMSFRKAEDALEAVKERPCEIAFLDIEMKGMNGITLAK